MNRFFKLSAVVAAVVVAAPAFAAASMDANLELDTKYGNEQNGVKRGISQGGRVEFNVAGKAGGANGFVAGRASLLLQKTGGAATDDMWGQIGTSFADVKFGRFEAVELFAVGKDVYVEDDNGMNHARTNELRGRFGSSPAHLALTVNAAPGVSFELGLVETKAVGEIKGVRPNVTFAAGPLSVKLGMESGRTNGATAAADVKFTGFGGVVSMPIAGGSVNLNFAQRTDKPAGGDLKHTAFGVMAIFGPAGFAYINDKDETAPGVSSKQNTIYAAYSLPLFATGATITPAFSYSKSKQDAGDGAASGVAVRVNYAF
ncbi:conserved hypothetical protein [Leptothrix cholodnii SP-6]|uniref:Porin n=1 Tax=Leptothrix cholodnii (strain ATCC 51168 / LMG 8142 / SP-6) TaxID=395495 RepID=B1Y2C3_LEPCP|nr:carbohydrate porin [Leptothrix cholodnii]ACB35576.1 conserved hypothetical protein [Leptothrix cholodnii SP-6]